nr:hypothetical protein [Micromonospora tarensis]
MPGDFAATQVRAEAAGDGEAADPPGAGGVEHGEQPGRVGAEVRHRVRTGNAAGQVDDLGDPVPVAECEHRGGVGDVDVFDDDVVGQERRSHGSPVRGGDDGMAEVRQGAGGMRADHAEASGHQDHRSTS